MTSSSENVVRRYFDALGTHDLDALDTVAFEPPRAAPGFVLVSSRSAAARRLLRPRHSFTRDDARCDRIYGGNH